jgi:hypothetical protein
VTLDAAAVYHDAVDEYTLLCDEAMTNMMHLVARYEELDMQMQPVYDLVAQMYAPPLLCCN